MKRLPCRRALAATILLALGAQALAQDPQDHQAGEGAVQLDTVTVTAQRREEQSQKTPMALTVVSGEQLDRLQVTRVDDLRTVTPNIIIEQNTGTSSGAKIIMRGVGADESMFTNDPAIAMYVDDVYIPRQNGAMFDLYDVERIEVLRGPQGTLYGRNATGGAIRYITRKPTGEDRLEFNVNVGNFGRRDARATAATRLGESLDVTAAVLTRNRGGYVYDRTNDRKINDQDVLAGRLAFATSWGEASYATLSIERLSERSLPTWASPAEMVDGQRVPVLGSYYLTETDTLGFNKLDQFGVALTNETDFGSFGVRHILHHRTMDHHFYMDVDGSNRMVFHVEQDQRQKQRGYEAQVTSYNEGRFNWVAGVFAFQESNSQPTRSDVFAVGNTHYVSQDTSAYALYAQGTWDLSDRMALTLGGRYSYENKDFNVQVERPDGSPVFDKAMDRSWTRPDWKVLLDYDFTDDVMGYASVTTGFKSGGYNGRGTTYETVAPVDEETLIAYEVGVKSSLWDNRLRLNANYYRLDYDGIQLAAVNPEGVFVTTNATGALIQGIEIDAALQATRKLNLTASLGTMDGEYQNFNETNAEYFRGRDMKYMPGMQATLGATFIQPVGNADLVFSGTARYSDSYFQNQDATRLVMTNAHTEVNARIAYEPTGANWSLALWGKNLTDKFIMTGGFDIPALGIGVVYPNLPRSYGLEFRYRM